MHIRTTGRAVSVRTIAFWFAQLSIVYKYLTSINQHFTGSSSLFNYDLLSFVMPLVVAMAIFLITQNNGRINRFYFLALCFYLYAIVISLVSQSYSITSLIFPAINMVYWVAVMYITHEYFRSYRQKYGSVQAEKKENKHFSLYFILLLVGFLLFLISYNQAKMMSFYRNRDVLMNSVYYLLFILPWGLCCKKKWIQNIAFIIMFVAAVFSSKRTPLLMVLICWCVWVVLSMKGKSAGKKVATILGSVLLTFIGYFLFLELTSSYELNIMERIDTFISGEDSGSGRGEIWSSTMEVILYDNWLVSLFGRGYRAVSVSSAYAGLSESHNDFLQVLFDYGLIGFVMLLGICGWLIAQGHRMRKCKYRYANAYIISLVIFFGGAMVSMVLIYPYWFIGMASFWGYVFADFEAFLRGE